MNFGGNNPYILSRPSVTPGTPFGGQYPNFQNQQIQSPGSPYGASYPNLGLMNLINKVDKTNVDGVANFKASLKNSKNYLDNVYGSEDSEINFITEEVSMEDLSIIE